MKTEERGKNQGLSLRVFEFPVVVVFCLVRDYDKPCCWLYQNIAMLAFER